MATAHDHGEVNIYELSKRFIRLKAELRTETLFDEEHQLDYFMEIVKMAFSHDKDLAVLCRMKAVVETPSPISDEDEYKLINGTRTFRILKLKLVIFHRCYAKTKGYFYSSDQSVFPEHSSSDSSLNRTLQDHAWLDALAIRLTATSIIANSAP